MCIRDILKSLANGQAYGSMPESFKSAIVVAAKFRGECPCRSGRRGHSWEEAVSYTHLDVYKRQNVHTGA